MTNFIQKGGTLTATAPVDGVVSGQAVLLGSIIGVCVTDAAEGDPVEVNVCGVYSLPKATGQAWAVGDALYWDTTNSVFTTDDTETAVAAYAAAAAASGDTTGHVKLNQ